jgi:hypothetical protein
LLVTWITAARIIPVFGDETLLIEAPQRKEFQALKRLFLQRSGWPICTICLMWRHSLLHTRNNDSVRIACGIERESREFSAARGAKDRGKSGRDE